MLYPVGFVAMTPWQHTLLNTMTGPALVCTSDASVQAWNEAAVRLLTPDAIGDASAAREQLGNAMLTNWIAPATWDELKTAASTDAPSVIVQLNGQPRRVEATRISPNGTPHWLLRAHPSPAPDLDPSHDLLRDLIESMRTPLASIRAAVETMQQYPSMDADVAAQFADVIASQGVRLTQMIDEAGSAYTAMYRTRRALEPMTGSALLTWARSIVDEATDIPVSADASSDAPTVHLDPTVLKQGLTFVSDRFVRATRCSALTVRLRCSDAVALLALSAPDGRTVTEARVETWKEKTIPWETPMMQLTLHALLDQHDAQFWVEQTETAGSVLRFAFPTAPAGE